MSEPLILKSSFSVSLVRVMQSVLPAIVAAAMLQIVSRSLDLQTSDRYTLLLGLVAVSTFIVVRPKESLTSLLISPHRALAVALLFRWCLNLLVLLAFLLATQILSFYPVQLLAWWAVVTPVALVLLMVPMQFWFRSILVSRENTKRAIIAGYNDASQALAQRLQSLHVQVDGFFDDRGLDRLGGEVVMPLRGRLPDLVGYVQANAVDVIFIALPMRHVQRVLNMLGQLRDTTASIYYVPDVFVFDLIQARTADVLGVPVVAMCETPLSGYGGTIKRLTDIAAAGIGVLMLSPLLLVVAGLVAMTSRGPVVFRQRRYGIDGQEIIVYKFRTMTVTEDGPTVAQATKDDKRVTVIGRFLRQTSIDELPQLFNVLQGTMSLVGPRPHAVAHNEEYRKLVPGYMIRHKVPPGITGLAQINGCRGELSSLDDLKARIHYDLEYLRHWSWLLDIKIIFRTLMLIWADKKAY